MARLALTFIAVFTIACTSSEPLILPEPPCNQVEWDGAKIRRNVVLVVNDTMRRDAPGVYGGSSATPALDQLAEDNLLFTNAYANANWTKPSMASLVTGLRPNQHGLLTFQKIPKEGFLNRHETEILDDRFSTLAETLLSAGYSTAGFVGNPWVGRALGFGQGFEKYDDSLTGHQAPGGTLADRALEWLDSRTADGPFFLYLHLMESHSPYGGIDPSEVPRLRNSNHEDRTSLKRSLKMSVIENSLRTTDGRTFRDAGLKGSIPLLKLAYRRGIENFDAVLSGFLSGLIKRSAYSNTAIIVTSDHGEALYERGWAGHGKGLFDDEISVPLVAKLPGTSATNPISCPVELIDIMPTLCVYLGAECPENQSGVSFLPAPGRSSRFIVSEGLGGNTNRSRSIRNSRFKLIYDPSKKREMNGSGDPYGMFEVQSDTDETHNLLALPDSSAKFDEIASTLKKALEDTIQVPRSSDPTKILLDPAVVDQLEALGYTDTNGTHPGGDP